MSNKNIIFDLDGTIIDSKLEVLNTYKKVIEQIPSSIQFDENTLDYGANLNTVLSSVYGNETDKIAQAKRLFISMYDTSDYKHTLLYDGAIEVFDFLRSNHYNLYIATNKRYVPTLKLVEAKKIQHFFTDIIGNEIESGVSINKSKMIEILMSKHKFENAYMIGDTIGDIEAGKNNHLKTIAVLYGYGTLSELSTLHPDHIIKSISELKKIMV